MSRIEELSTLVKNQTTLVDNLESLIEKERLLKTRYANELFEATKALEAQERKPRTWQMYLTDAGMLHPNTIYLGGPFGKTRHFEPITVIEKLPVKVTREMAFKIDKAWDRTCKILEPVYGAKKWKNPIFWVEVLKAAGIDAELSND